MCKTKFINQGKRWKEKEYLMLILMYLTGVLLYYREHFSQSDFPSLKYFQGYGKTKFCTLLTSKYLFRNPFGKVLSKLRSKEAILNKLDYNIGYYPIVKQPFIGYKRKENKDATTKFKRISLLLFESHFYTNINQLENRAHTIKCGYTTQKNLFASISIHLISLHVRKIISQNDCNNIIKTINNLLK